jgi:hypothetical protein
MAAKRGDVIIARIHFIDNPAIVKERPLHSTLKCNTKVSDFEGCFEAQALPGSVIKP